MNVVAVMGRFTSDPEIKKTNSGTSVTSFTLAVQRDRKDPNGEYPTDWIDVVAWEKTAEFVCKYFAKGQMAAIQGSLQTRNWEDKKGGKHKATELVAQQVFFCGDKPKDQGREEPAAQEEPKAAPQQMQDFSQGSLDDYKMVNDEDLPF